jgi:hypothetical protein
LITKEALKEMLDGWVSVSRFKSEIRENFRTSLGTQVEKNVKSAANLPRFSVDVVL